MATPTKLVNMGLHSWGALVSYAERRAAGESYPGGGSASLREDHDQWSGVSTIGDAIKLAREGWQAGALAVGRALDRVTPEQDVAPDWDLEVAGSFPCVPALLAGAPDHFWRQTEEKRGARRLALIVNGVMHAGIKAADALGYAKAVAATARAIEAAGIDTAIYSIDARRGVSGAAYVGCKVRDYGEHMDLARVAYAFHPSFLRRIYFAFDELDPVAVKEGLSSGGYGQCAELSNETVSEFLGDTGAACAVLPSINSLSHADELGNTDKQVAAMIEKFRTTCEAAIAAAGG